MAPTLSFKLNLLFTDEVKDSAGNWQYATAGAVESTSGAAVKLIATKRENHSGNVPIPASMLTATVMFSGHHDSVPQNLTLQGVHDLKSNSETGSVSAASSDFADYIGGQFTFAAGLLQIHPRK